MISRFDRTVAGQFHKELDSLLRDFAQKNGLTYKPSSAKFSDDSFSGKFEFNTGYVDGMSFNQANWNKNCKYYDLTEADFGKNFMSHGKMFKITGINTRNYKMPILATEFYSGKKYKFASSIVKSLINVNAARHEAKMAEAYYNK